MQADQGYSMRVVARRTGLSPHVIRVWERRYGAVTPGRTPTGHRTYTDADIERLQLLRDATQAGHSISRITHLSNEELRKLSTADETARPDNYSKRAAKNAAPGVVKEPARSFLESRPEVHLKRCLSAVGELDAPALEAALAQSLVALGQRLMMDEVVAPLMQQVGDAWRHGTLRIVHEHLASAIVRTFLGQIAQKQTQDPTAPVVVVTTPPGQVHEIGAMMAAATATSEGWRVVYLGANLPVEEIAAAVLHSNARVLALSMVYPMDDAHLHDDLRRLSRFLPPHVILVAGGRAIEQYASVLKDIGAIAVHSLMDLRVELEQLRKNEVRS
ncbi:MAG TPA: MerR family transcriptional regulator [Abditibacteriaceae bacterium]